MSDIQQGSPPSTSAPKQVHYEFKLSVEAMLDEAMDNPGEWFSVPIPGDVNPGSASAIGVRSLIRRMGEWSTKEGRLWIRRFDDE